MISIMIKSLVFKEHRGFKGCLSEFGKFIVADLIGTVAIIIIGGILTCLANCF